MIAQLNDIAQIWWQWMGGMFWQVSLLIIFVSVIDRAIRRWAWPQVRYVLWGLVFLKLIIPPTWQMPTSIVSWIQPLFEKQISIQIEPVEATPGIFLEMDAEILSQRNNNSNEGLSRKSALFLGWLCGMVAFGSVLIRKMFQLRIWHRYPDAGENRDLKIPEWFNTLLSDTAARLNLKKRPTVIFSSEAKSPAVYGLFRTVLLLPEGFFNRLSREEAEHVLIHELCHLKRGDLWVHWFCLVLQMIYWFNPLLIWTRRRMRHLCEICCDLSVANILREKTRYYRETLIRTARDLFTETVEPSLGLLGVFEEPFRIVPRLQWLEKNTWENPKRKSASIIVTSLIMVVCVMPMAGLSQSPTQKEGSGSVYAEPTPEISREAKEALLESQRREEENPEDYASARQPLIDFMSVTPQEMVPLVAYQMLGQFWYTDRNAENNVEEAQKIFKKGFEAFPDNSMLLLNYAVVTYELKQYEEAALLFERYYYLDDTNGVQHLNNAASAYYAAGNKADAKRIFKEMIEVAEVPKHEWIKNLVSICRELGDLDEAALYEAQYAEQKSIDSENNDGVYNLADVDERPRLTRAFPPRYPDAAKEENIGGQIVVEAVVTKEGIPRDPWVIDAEPPDIFEEAALEAVMRYQFKPGIRNGEAVDVRVEVPIHFVPKEPDEEYLLDPEAEDLTGIEYNMNEVNQPPRVLRTFPPEYPVIAREDKIEGRVLLRIVVDTDGTAKEAEVVEATPPGVFEEAALDAVKRYQFNPARKDGKPVACIVKIPITFDFKDDGVYHITTFSGK